MRQASKSGKSGSNGQKNGKEQSKEVKDLIEMVATLETKGIGLKSLQESIDTSTATGKLVPALLFLILLPMNKVGVVSGM